MIISKKVKGLLRQLTSGFAASLSTMAAATVIGWLSPTIPRLLSAGSDLQITLEEASWLATIPQFGILISPMPAAILADLVGRKTVMLTTGPLFVIGWAIVVHFKYLYCLYIARFIHGIGIGLVCTLLPMYLGEIAAPNFRGIITSMFCTCWCLGLIFEYIFGDLLSYNSFTYLTAFINVVFLILFVWQPESPYYYLVKNDLDKARASLSWLTCASAEQVSAELSRMKQAIDDGKKNNVSWTYFFVSRENRKPLIIMFLLAVISMLCGVVPLSTYANETINKAGDCSLLSPDGVTRIMGVMLLLGSLCSSFSFDVFGRVPTYFVSCSLSGICMVIVGTFLFLESKSIINSSLLNWIELTGLILFSLTSATGMYPATAVYPTEIFDTSSRAKANSINTILTTFLAILPFRFYLPIENVFGAFVNFYIFSLVCFNGSILSLTLLPETKGKSLEQVRIELKNG